MRFETPWGVWNSLPGSWRRPWPNQAELQPWINHVQAGLRSLAATVNNVLHFHSQPSAQLLPVDLLRLVGETVEFLRPLARQKEMHIEWRAPMATVSILADPSRLQQAFLNLALNAFRAMKPGGTLSVSVCRREEVPPHGRRRLCGSGSGHPRGEFGKDI